MQGSSRSAQRGRSSGARGSGAPRGRGKSRARGGREKKVVRTGLMLLNDDILSAVCSCIAQNAVTSVDGLVSTQALSAALLRLACLCKRLHRFILPEIYRDINCPAGANSFGPLLAVLQRARVHDGTNQALVATHTQSLYFSAGYSLEKVFVLIHLCPNIKTLTFSGQTRFSLINAPLLSELYKARPITTLNLTLSLPREDFLTLATVFPLLERLETACPIKVRQYKVAVPAQPGRSATLPEEVLDTVDNLIDTDAPLFSKVRFLTITDGTVSDVISILRVFPTTLRRLSIDLLSDPPTWSGNHPTVTPWPNDKLQANLSRITGLESLTVFTQTSTKNGAGTNASLHPGNTVKFLASAFPKSLKHLVIHRGGINWLAKDQSNLLDILSSFHQLESIEFLDQQTTPLHFTRSLPALLSHAGPKLKHLRLTVDQVHPEWMAIAKSLGSGEYFFHNDSAVGISMGSHKPALVTETELTNRIRTICRKSGVSFPQKRFTPTVASLHHRRNAYNHYPVHDPYMIPEEEDFDDDEDFGEEDEYGDEYGYEYGNDYNSDDDMGRHFGYF